MQKLRIMFVLLVVITIRAVSAGQSVPEVKIQHGDLNVEFRDNSSSPRVLSGIQSLVNTRHAPDFDAYDPDAAGASAGLNFEHIISGHRNRNNKFTPRHGSYRLHQLDDQSVRLVRDREDSPWQVSSSLTYRLSEPHYIDFEFRCIPHNADLFGPRGYAIFFFANYMNDVADVSLNFLGIQSREAGEKWIAADAPKTHPDWNGGGTYRHRDATDLSYDQDLRFRLNSWTYDYPRYTKPFYYGNADHGMVLILMFDRAYSNEDEIRFSLFKFKLPKHPRPAWDFQYVIHKVQDAKQYGFRGRLVWKKFVSAEDCLREYEKWTSGNE